MRGFGALISIVFVIAVFAVIGGFLIPPDISFRRFVVIEAPPEQVLAVVTDTHSFPKWLPWVRADRNARYEFTGPEQGTGGGISWSAQDHQAGGGSVKITSVSANRIDLKVSFAGRNPASSTFLVEPFQGKTKITWSFSSKVSSINPYTRYMSLLVPSVIGNEYLRGLANLKSLVEARQPRTNTSQSPSVSPSAAAVAAH